MKTSTPISLIAASIAAIALTSCVMPMDEYPAGGFSSGGGGYSSPSYYSSPTYVENDFYYYDGGSYPSYYRPSYGSYTAGYSYYRGSSVCPICHRNPCGGHSGRSNTWRSSSSYSHYDRDHDDHRYVAPSPSHSFFGRSNDHDHDDHHSSSPPLYMHNGGGGGAQGAHPKEWFTSRGYAPSRLEKTDNGGHSTKKNDHDDDDKKKHRH